MASDLALFDLLNQAVHKPVTATENTRAVIPFGPGDIGIRLGTGLDTRPKEVASRLAEEFPTGGMEPEVRAQLNMSAKMSKKAVIDSAEYTQKAGEIAGNMSKIYGNNVRHWENMSKADLQFKQADATHLGNIQHWQQETVSILDTAREKHAGIVLFQGVL